MKDHIKALILLCLFVLLIGGCVQKQEIGIASPNGYVTVSFAILEGVPHYSVSYRGIGIIDASALGFRLKDSQAIHAHLKVDDTRWDAHDQTWKPVWGKRAEVRNCYNQLTINLQEKVSPSRKMNVIFRVYDDGVFGHFDDYSILDRIQQTFC